MTKQESFKRRIRARMEKTGEKYNAARRALISQADSSDWVSQPEMTDESVRDATGKGWNEWRRVIDLADIDVNDHGAIVSLVTDSHGVGGWWAQSIAVGYERITGIRLPHQMPDGTFSVSKTKTMSIDADLLRKMLLSDDDRADLFPGHETELRSGETAKTLRIGIGGGVAQFAMDPKDGGRTSVTVAHEKLAEASDVEAWRAYWGDWLDAIAAS